VTIPKHAAGLAAGITVALALAACGGSTDSSAAVTATAAPAATATTKLLSRSPKAQLARRRDGPVLLGPPLVVRRVAPGPNRGPEIWIRVRFRLASKVDLAKNTGGLDRGGYQGTSRGSVRITGIRSTATTPSATTPTHITMGDSHGFTPNGKASGRGWCYGAEVELDLEPVPEAQRLADVRTGEPRAIRIAVASRGGGTTAYAVPIYDERDSRVAAAARATRCERP
jgi:hypothetical protein